MPDDSRLRIPRQKRGGSISEHSGSDTTLFGSASRKWIAFVNHIDIHYFLNGYFMERELIDRAEAIHQRVLQLRDSL
jgi:hypothetical protein